MDVGLDHVALDLVKHLAQDEPLGLLLEDGLDAGRHPPDALLLLLGLARGARRRRRGHLAALAHGRLLELAHHLLLLVGRRALGRRERLEPVGLGEVVGQLEPVDGRLARAVRCGLDAVLLVDPVARDGEDGVGGGRAEPGGAVAAVERARDGRREGRQERLEVLVEVNAVGREEQAAEREALAGVNEEADSMRGKQDALLQLAQRGQVEHEAAHLGADLVPDRVELDADEVVE
mgnify:CR=1 FL=1